MGSSSSDALSPSADGFTARGMVALGDAEQAARPNVDRLVGRDHL